MSNPLPRLRLDLDFMRSPVEEQPGLLMRDSFHYSDAVLVIPPPLVPCLVCFDGTQTELDLRKMLLEITGDLQTGQIAEQLIRALSANGFLQDDTYNQMRAAKHAMFAAASVREPAHAGSAYPDEAQELREVLAAWMDGAQRTSDEVFAIAAPHVSPGGGYESYRAAYSALPKSVEGKTFVVLGTSHYGMPDRFGITRKPYRTPLGDAHVHLDLLDELIAKAPDAVTPEDYCHAVEHSIEFQVLFLQGVYGPDIRILPILCGSFARSIYNGGTPEDDDQVRRFFGTLGEISAREGDRLLWVLGVDMAHIGRRYDDELDARAYEGEMLDVQERDRDRIARLVIGDAKGFWERVQENRDDLKWCGSSPFYTFLRVKPGVRGTLEKYEQWNIDEKSVVSFAGMTFGPARRIVLA